MSALIPAQRTATPAATTSRCIACELDHGPHDCAQYTVPVAQRSTVTVRANPTPDPDPLIPGYRTDLAYPAI